MEDGTEHLQDEAKEWARKILAASNGQSIIAISQQAQHQATWPSGMAPIAQQC